MDHHSHPTYFMELVGILAYCRSKWPCPIAPQEKEVLHVNGPDTETVMLVSSSFHPYCLGPKLLGEAVILKSSFHATVINGPLHAYPVPPF